MILLGKARFGGSIPWILMDDFSAIHLLDEKMGGDMLWPV